MQVYTDERPNTTVARPSEARRGVSSRTVIDTAKEAVKTIDLADRLAGPGKMRKVGKEWVTNCLLPDHEDRSPSFTVNPEKDLWFCHGCLRGGDVVTLARLVWGIDRADTAAAEVLMAFGYEDHIPQRPASWFRRQERQKPVRDAIEATKMQLARKRLYRWYFAPLVEAVEDPADRAHDEQMLWEATEPLARHLVANMMGGGR